MFVLGDEEPQALSACNFVNQVDSQMMPRHLHSDASHIVAINYKLIVGFLAHWQSPLLQRPCPHPSLFFKTINQLSSPHLVTLDAPPRSCLSPSVPPQPAPTIG